MKHKKWIGFIAVAVLAAGCSEPIAKPSVTYTEVSPSPEATVAGNIIPSTPPPTPSPTPPNTPSPEPTETEQDGIVPIIVTIPDATQTPSGDSAVPTDSNGQISNKKMEWYFMKNSNHQPPGAQREFDISQFDGYYLGDTSRQIIYLTFDEGYENGYTEKILDILKEKDVKAAFFLTKPYIRGNVDLVCRMVDEGHIAANHSNTHPSFPGLTDQEIIDEIIETEDYFHEVTGSYMSKVFRPPMGEYSARTLQITQSLGYKTIFWSFAYADWDVNAQPGKAVAYKTVMDNLHNGEIILLHAVSESNTEALPDIIDSIREYGFSFESLLDLPVY